MKKPAILWVNTLFFLVTFLVAAIGVPYWALSHGFSTGLLVAFALVFGYAGMSITAGYHRLWSHKTYQAHPALRWLFALGGALAIQNSILHWSSDHRVHHRHVDNNDIDPYSAGRGFWYSHIGWMLREYQAERYDDYSNVRDLQKDPIVVFQHRHYLLLALVMNLVLPLAIGLALGDVIGAVLLVGFMRIVLTHHTTFFINSLAHIWGKRTYTDKHSAKDNGILAFLTFGEGYHNFHHTFENDYRNGIRWYQFDPTKWLIRGAHALGLTSQLRRTPEELILKAKLTRQLEESQAKAPAGACLKELQHRYEELVAAAQSYYQLRKRWLQMKQAKLKKDVEALALREQLDELKASLRQQLSHWQQLRLQLA
ncbi:fatty acid desaturase [Gallaecimonas sp. GXIMD4217]|uniref:acyl-CoA desaturase n=1 Tax=Gallaecimonas sp. GXIMD4217 TaxID=3131927 RepID=UPI00311B0CAF